MALDRTLLLAGVGVLLLLVSTVRRYIAYRKLRAFKGPPVAAWTNMWLAKQIARNNRLHAEQEAMKKYGSPLRVAPNLLVTDDPELMRHMSAPRSGWTRGGWYDGVKFGSKMNSVFSERNEKIHNETKAMEIGAYQMRDVLTVEEDIDKCLLDTLRLLETRYRDKACDMAELPAWFTLDTLSKIAFGESFGFLAADEDLWGYNEFNRGLFGPLNMILSIPWLRNAVCNTPLLDLISPKPNDGTGAGHVIQFARDRIQARYASDPKGTDRRDFMGHFIRKGLTQSQCEAESRLQVIAGSDSTSSAIRNTFNHIVTNTRVYTKLLAEIEGASAAGRISYPIITNAEAQQLPYLQACIWEGLRVWPPLTGLQSKLAPPQGDTFKGRFYPPGVEVGVNYLAMCRRKDIFGADADVFRPERFSDVDAETRESLIRVTDTIFGSGKYGCLGKNIGFVEQNKFIVEMIRKFDWSVADPHKGSLIVDAGLWVQKGMDFYVQRRSD